MKDKISVGKGNDKADSCSYEPGESKRRRKNMGDGGAIYGMGLIGAVIYFIQHSTTFAEGAIGVLKAIFWPGVLIYKALEYLKM
jgi:hypothetical protein